MDVVRIMSWQIQNCNETLLAIGYLLERIKSIKSYTYEEHSTLIKGLTTFKLIVSSSRRIIGE